MERLDYLSRIEARLGRFGAVALLGPRQVGKTHLARAYCGRIAGFNWVTSYFDLEDPAALARLSDPKLALERLDGLVVIDEVQRSPELFPVLRYLLDRPDNRLQFLILGSASRELIRQSSESLAGRIAHIEVTPFGLHEVGPETERRLWLRGGFPLAYLAESDQVAFDWLDELTRTYLERDIPQLGFRVPAPTLRRLWAMLVHNHAGILNQSELGRSLGLADTTIRRHLDILAGTFMVRLLQPWWANIHKRQAKRPKVYFRDSGLLHLLLGVRSHDALTVHPRLGASWEGFALEAVLRQNRVREEDAYFWSVHSQAELDLVIPWAGKLHGFEFKHAAAPTMTRSMRTALDTLELASLTVVAPVAASYPLSQDVEVKPIAECILPG